MQCAAIPCGRFRVRPAASVWGSSSERRRCEGRRAKCRRRLRVIQAPLRPPIRRANSVCAPATTHPLILHRQSAQCAVHHPSFGLAFSGGPRCQGAILGNGPCEQMSGCYCEQFGAPSSCAGRSSYIPVGFHYFR
ncbi:uncharacterized protein BDZ99DRAFT_16288 [Mytilinidion resinicola]|uniref:Uncharacterized protein n=1 Tax=Mytilinidion resinicola TaxID=574789 RepID=A0A6A6ZAY5_9PEZI|nr:uncharacterized protein BDZ99DRAFT_16288 [Mytilinidion resinicola]KAF2817465.1 hypothetical protein BDZ99DRAFT_16288 [Mytilinidion resinicola]